MKRLAAAGLILLAPLASCRLRGPAPTRPIVVDLGPAWTDVPPLAREGLRMLMGDLAVTSGATTFEPQTPGLSIQGRVEIQLEGALLPGGLRLSAHLHAPGQPDQDIAPTAADPGSQMVEILAAAGLRSRNSPSILPRDPSRLLPLADLYGRARRGSDAEAISAAQDAASFLRTDPGCAPAAYARGAGLYRGLLEPGPPDVEALAACHEAFDQALQLVPGYPRAAAFQARVCVDTGNQRLAFQTLLPAISRWPRALGLRPMLAYAARTSGLLGTALDAIRQEQALRNDPLGDEILANNALLYAGEWDRFESSLSVGSDERPDPMREFYRGYIRLLRGNQAGAEAYFKKATAPTERDPDFQALAAAYLAALDGHRAEGLLTLRRVAQSRQGLRIPDGEFTFKLAEAFAYLGDTEGAMNAAQLAFSQGFGCTPWYGRTPLLAPLHALPRWRALISHLQARQKLMEDQFASVGSRDGT
ncbi:MAG: hypothetical protein JST05_03935 [Acidobacteria bacterium]|nr:hypothetical protein [Acidobacteriota bacterium]